jgi:hypothetical protein
MPADAFTSPYVDVDEWREAPHPHHYVHGGFTGTDTRFSVYFPPPAEYGDRFITVVEGGQAGHEVRAAKLTGDALPSIAWAFSCGAYLVESNGGHIASGAVALTQVRHDIAVTAYEATAAATRYARELATERYGRRPRYGYVIGGSGGGRALVALENTQGIWDGVVQYINAAGHGISMPSVLSNAVRVLGSDVSTVAAAFEPGGDGDPFRGLTAHQREALATLYRSGFQPGGEFQLEHPEPELGVMLILSSLARDFDAAYFEEFWTVPGYEGADGALAAEVVDEVLTVDAVVTAADFGGADRLTIDRMARRVGLTDGTAVGIRARGVSLRHRGAAITMLSGTAAQRPLVCLGVIGDVLILDFANSSDLTGIQPGDSVHIDNRHFLAYCYSYRHQIDVDAPESRQFMVGGVPIYPQQEIGVQDVLVGVRLKAEFDGKAIYVGSVNDSMSSPIGWPVTYAGQVRAKLGAAAADRMRVWLNEHSTHIQASDRPPGKPPVATTRLVDWIGSVEQAMLDLINWVEQGAAPPADTHFAFDDGRIVLAEEARDRTGIQPVVSATANGSVATSVAVGEPVRLAVHAEAPPGAGRIVRLEWDFDGDGTWPYDDPAVDGSSTSIECEVFHSFAYPGTYFPAVRATLHREGVVRPAHGAIPNLARVRVDVRSASNLTEAEHAR